VISEIGVMRDTGSGPDSLEAIAYTSITTPMRILSLTAGAGGMYCGSCLRDNALAAELLVRGHDVTLVPLYTPLLTDEPNVSRPEVLFGGISVYLQHHFPLLRRLPRAVDRLLDRPGVIKAFADRSASTDPKMLGGLTVSMLEGPNGSLAREFDKLLTWVTSEPKPDVITLTNSMLIAFAQPLADTLRRPVVCTLQGEDLFVDGLIEPYRARALELMRHHAGNVAHFVAVSEYYRRFMAGLLNVSSDRISVVPLGINTNGYEQRSRDVRPTVFRVGYLARVAPEKGLHVLADAFLRFRSRVRGESPSAGPANVRLEVAGYMAKAQAAYLDGIKNTMAGAGAAADFAYHGTVDRTSKLAFLKTLDVLSVPATYDEPKGFFLLEAMAAGIPVVQPRRGSFLEIVERTGGGLLVEPNAAAIADGLHRLWSDPELARQLGDRGYAGVRAHHTVQRSADRFLEVLSGVAPSSPDA
jgi:glycosyltransferase involved in cell wall biosynthesis